MSAGRSRPTTHYGQTGGLFGYVSYEALVPEGHPLRAIHGDQPRPDHDAEGDLYGENGERMPYYPAHPRQQRSDELDVLPRECSRFLDCI